MSRGVSLNAWMRDFIAAHVHCLDWTIITGTYGLSPAARCMWQALRRLRNRWVVTGTTNSVKREDDSTEAWSEALTVTPGASPVTGADPT